MSEDRRDILQVLRYELNFLEQGGYNRSVQERGGKSPFQDSLSCLNYGDPTRPHTCRECLLYDFVPEESRTEDIPCHFIPIDERGNTIATLLRRGETKELEAKLEEWLRSEISSLESQQVAGALTEKAE